MKYFKFLSMIAAACLAVVSCSEKIDTDIEQDQDQDQITETTPVVRPDVKKWYSYKKATKVEDGKSYIIVAKDKAGVPFLKEDSYGYMNTTGVVTNGDDIIASGRNSFTLKSTDGGYLISQNLDSRYLYMTESYNSFNLSKTVPSVGHVWAISAEDGAFSIINKSKNKIMQYDPEYKTYAAYAELDGVKPCLYECVKETAAPAEPVYTTAPKWMELPQTKEDDGLDFYSHNHIVNGAYMRSWSFDYDPEALLSHWVAYPLNSELIGRGKRSDEWGYDPLVPKIQQPELYKSYRGEMQRGHQLPSADRLDYEANVETFYFTNIAPQSSGLNEGAWSGLEMRVREWAASFDTLYVVTGCSIKGSTEKTYDNIGKEVTVPVAYYKALLGYKKDGGIGITGETGGYTGCAFWFENKPYSGTYMDQSMTIDELEEKLELDLFVNLDSAIADKVENTKDSWWK